MGDLTRNFTFSNGQLISAAQFHAALEAMTIKSGVVNRDRLRLLEEDVLYSVPNMNAHTQVSVSLPVEGLTGNAIVTAYPMDSSVAFAGLIVQLKGVNVDGFLTFELFNPKTNAHSGGVGTLRVTAILPAEA